MVELNSILEIVNSCLDGDFFKKCPECGSFRKITLELESRVIGVISLNGSERLVTEKRYRRYCKCCNYCFRMYNIKDY